MKTACRSNTRTQLGFTLIELVVTVSIVAILATVVAPNLQSYIQNNRINSTAQELLRTLQTARGEATKRQARVVVCLSAITNDGTPACTTSNPTGWIMFADTDGNDWEYCPPGGNCISGNDKLIKQYSLNLQIKVLADNGKRVSYDATGFASVNGATTQKSKSTAIIFCDKRGNADIGGGNGNVSVARSIIIQETGRANITKDRTTIQSKIPAGSSCS